MALAGLTSSDQAESNLFHQQQGDFMAIKNLRLSFDVPIAELLALVATRNSALHIDVISDHKEPRKKLANGTALAGLLEGPKSTRAGRARGEAHRPGKDADGQRITVYQAICKTILAAPDQEHAIIDLGKSVAEHHLNPKSVSPQISIMVKAGDVKRSGFGKVKLTKQGSNHFAKVLRDREATMIGAQP
jgi:hypothetical protein